MAARWRRGRERSYRPGGFGTAGVFGLIRSINEWTRSPTPSLTSRRALPLIVSSVSEAPEPSLPSPAAPAAPPLLATLGEGDAPSATARKFAVLRLQSF